MCGRFTLRTPATVLAKQFDLSMQLDLLGDLKPRYNIAPTQQVLAVRDAMPGKREPVWFRWGLIPSWADDPKIAYSLINARADTVHTKPSFRSAFKQRRCLVLADGYYEWKKLDSKNKQPYYFQRADGAAFAFAGLWEHWHKVKEPVESCTLITTEPNTMAATVHDRMPVILNERDYDTWLSSDTDPSRLRQLLAPLPDGDWTAIPVSNYVSKATNQGPECIEAAG
ncbi:MAG: SOS response-associated peptidase [Planctomycetes bacterium]|nr:SOS response-associated peptidase [Planctomycetota bacterium]